MKQDSGSSLTAYKTKRWNSNLKACHFFYLIFYAEFDLGSNSGGKITGTRLDAGQDKQEQIRDKVCVCVCVTKVV